MHEIHVTEPTLPVMSRWQDIRSFRIEVTEHGLSEEVEILLKRKLSSSSFPLPPES